MVGLVTTSWRAAAKDARDGHLVRLWTLAGEPGESRAIGLYQNGARRFFKKNPKKIVR